MARLITRIVGITPDERHAIRRAVAFAMRVWPNSHLGDQTPREDMRSAFRTIRNMFERHGDMEIAAGDLERDCYAYEDM